MNGEFIIITYIKHFRRAQEMGRRMRLRVACAVLSATPLG